MNPGKIAGANHDFGKPKTWDDATQGECVTLPVLNTGTTLQSAWFPSAEELGAMNQGCPVVLTIWGRQHPVVAVGVAPTPDSAEMMCDHGRTIAQGCERCRNPHARIDLDQVNPKLFMPAPRKKQ